MSIKDKYFVGSISYEECKEWLLYKHYAKRIPSISYSFGLFNNRRILKGICTFGEPIISNLSKKVCNNTFKNILELNRLIKNDGLEKNVQSWFVSQCFKLLISPLIIISYSDENFNHFGYTYQALNFYYTGTGGSKYEFIYKNKQYTSRHINKEWFKKKNLNYNENETLLYNFKNIGGELILQKPKHRYFYFLGNKKEKKEMLKNFNFPILPYPKGDNKRYDTKCKITVKKRLYK